MEPVNAIELLGVTKRFGEVVANDNVNLTVRKGEILSILGENGSGKTTLMNMLSGIYFPDEGEIRVNGKTVTIRSPKDSFDQYPDSRREYYFRSAGKRTPEFKTGGKRSQRTDRPLWF